MNHYAIFIYNVHVTDIMAENQKEAEAKWSALIKTLGEQGWLISASRKDWKAMAKIADVVEQ